jgi:hypothetical protein
MTIRHGDDVIKDFWGLLENGIKTDFDLGRLDPDNFDDEPWFAAYDITNNYDEVAGHETYDDIGIIEGNLDEMIKLVEEYITRENK